MVSGEHRVLGTFSEGPAVGMSINLPLTDILGEKITLSEKQDFVLAMMGSCRSCSIRDIDSVEISRALDVKVFYVYENTVESLSEEVRREALRTTTIADPSSTLAFELDVKWTPRLYRFNSKGKLLSFEQAPGGKF